MIRYENGTKEEFKEAVKTIQKSKTDIKLNNQILFLLFLIF